LEGALGDTGPVQVEVLNEAGDTVSGFSSKEGGRFKGDRVHSRVEWGERSLSQLKDGEYRLRFRMRRGSLYSYELA